MNICVYCSASDQIAPQFFEVARELGSLIARRGDTLVYGGASVGLMGCVAEAVQADGGHVVGVIPERLVAREIAYKHADELLVTADMRERKAAMENRADAFFALPGGLGTLEEITEIMNLRKLGYTDKPLVLLNIDGFYDPLVVLLDHMIKGRFLDAYTELFTLAPDVPTAFKLIE